MKNFQPITPEIIEKLKAITGPTYVKTDRDLLLQYQTDYETNPAMFHVPDAPSCRPMPKKSRPS